MLMENLASKTFQHEIRTPVTTILGMIQSLKNETLSMTQENYINEILNSAKQLLNFANTFESKNHQSNLANPLISLENLKVLLIEDHPLIRQIHQSMLSDLKCEVTLASDATEALALASQPYDFIITDIGLPDMDGITLAKQLKKRPNHANTPILALTAYTDFNTQQSCLEAGIVEVLHKPIELNTLAAVLRSHRSAKEGSKA